MFLKNDRFYPSNFRWEVNIYCNYSELVLLVTRLDVILDFELEKLFEFELYVPLFPLCASPDICFCVYVLKLWWKAAPFGVSPFKVVVKFSFSALGIDNGNFDILIFLLFWGKLKLEVKQKYNFPLLNFLSPLVQCLPLLHVLCSWDLHD